MEVGGKRATQSVYSP